MAKKFKIVICSGTACYVLGGAQLMMLEELLPSELKQQVEIVGSGCLQACLKKDAKPPFVKINDYLISNASINKVIEYLQSN